MTVSQKRKFEDVANLYLLTNCDMECSFCYASKDLGLMSAERASAVIDFLAAAGASRINLTGGEILMHPDAETVVKHAADAGLLVTLFTSGSMLTRSRASKFLPYIDWLALSLDGPPEINVAVGRSERHFDATLNALRLTRELSPRAKIRIASVVTRINVEHLGELAETLVDPGLTPDLWRLKQMVPTRRAKEQKDELGIEEKDFYLHMSRLERDYADRIPIQVHAAASKVADTMCIHPNGAATVTLGDGDDMNIVGLGNMFVDPDRVLDSWWVYRDEDNADNYGAMWAGRASGVHATGPIGG